jgi:uncharacterized protein (DUF302 family)
MKIINLSIGMVAGIIMVSVIGWLVMPKLMLKEYQSPYSIEKTVEKIKENAVSEGWVVSNTVTLSDSIKKHGGGDILPVILINLCEANHAFKILSEDRNKIVSVMMPCTISVYQKSDGKTYIGTMNAKLLGNMFGGTVAKVMGREVAAQQQKFISFIR